MRFYFRFFALLRKILQTSTVYALVFALVSPDDVAVAYMESGGFVFEIVLSAGEYGLKAFRHFQKHRLSVLIEFAQNVVQKKHGRFAYFVFVDDHFAEFHCKSDGALLTLRGKLAAVVAVYFDFYVVAMRTDGGKSKLLVLLP